MSQLSTLHSTVGTVTHAIFLVGDQKVEWLYSTPSAVVYGIIYQQYDVLLLQRSTILCQPPDLLSSPHSPSLGP